MKAPRALRVLGRRMMRGLVPNQSLALTREGRSYLAVWATLMGIGLYLQSNLVLLIAGLAAGPLIASVFLSAASLRRLEVTRRAPGYVFAGSPLALDYTLGNLRRAAAALAIELNDELVPADRSDTQATRTQPRVVFSRVPSLARERLRWQGTLATRGRYRFGSIEIISRSPFGLLERKLTETRPAALLVYPRVGKLTRSWQAAFRESAETRRGRRHERSTQQLEYHGLRDYRPGDSPRWIHWRTTARLAQPMVKEFEQQSDQDLAILIDPWMPRSRVTTQHRQLLESVLSFAATLALETCRQRTGRRLALGWTGPMPGVVHGPASVKLLHELLEQLALMRPTPEGSIAGLLDALPPSLLRDGMLVVASTRRVNLREEAESSGRLRGGSGRGTLAHALNLDASRGDLDNLVEFGSESDLLVDPPAQAAQAGAGGDA